MSTFLTWQLPKFKLITLTSAKFSDQRKEVLSKSGTCVGSAKSQREVAQETPMKIITFKFPCV